MQAWKTEHRPVPGTEPSPADRPVARRDLYPLFEYRRSTSVTEWQQLTRHVPVLVQALSAKLGLATGLSLAELCRRHYRSRGWEIVSGAVALGLLLGHSPGAVGGSYGSRLDVCGGRFSGMPVAVSRCAV